MPRNPLHAIDFYKSGHIYQYPEGTELVYSNLTPRSNKLANVPGDEVVFFGLQHFIKSYLIREFKEGFFDQPRNTVIAAYKRRMDNSLGKDSIGTDHISALHDLGFLPIEINALPEGTRVPMGVPVLTIENTLPEFYWLTNYLESILSVSLWKAITSATTAAAYRALLNDFAERTGDPAFVQWQGHDFSFRGMSSFEDAVLSGAAHLLSFTGTDTVGAIDLLEEFYNADSDQELIGGSVPATEHSVMCMGGKATEIETFRRLINDVYPVGIVSIVSDTWDFWKVMTETLPELKAEILARDGKVVIRPDSGDPVKIICGDKDCLSDSPEGKGAMQLLWEVFGGHVNERGFKVLDPHIGLIYGDSITLERARSILRQLEAAGFASTNVVFGIGSFTYNYVTRDTWGFAVKSTYGRINGEAVEIFKKPATDTGSKHSAKGLLSVLRSLDGKLKLVEGSIAGNTLLRPVYRNGQLLVDTSLAAIRKRVNPVITDGESK
jgi:nicotinamide phosphoribosyltransferase